MVSSIKLLFDTIFSISWQFICNKFGRPRINCIENIASDLARHNIIYSKFFQSLSSGCEFLNEQEMDFLSKFNDNAPYTEDELYDIHELIIELNNKVSNVEIIIENDKPIKSGIVAIVYEAVLKDKNSDKKRPIILKVARKNISERLIEATDKIRTLVNFISNFPYLNRLDLPTIFNENVNDILSQVDFEREVNNAIKMRENFKNIDYIKIPKVFFEYTSLNKNVIVMEKIVGKRINEVAQEDKNKYSLMMAKFSLKCILYDAFYHADLHAGNVFFIKKDGNYKLGIIDFGIMGEITREEQNNFYMFFKEAAVEKDSKRAAEVLSTSLIEPRDRFSNLGDEEKNVILDDLAKVTEETFNSEYNFGIQTIHRINTILEPFSLKLAREFCKIELSLAISNSVCMELCDEENTYIDSLNTALNDMMSVNVMF